MKNFYKKYFYTIPEAYLKLEDIDMSFYDIVRVFIISMLLCISLGVILLLTTDFVSWNFKNTPESLRLSLVLIFFYFLLLKKWWKSKD